MKKQLWLPGVVGGMLFMVGLIAGCSPDTTAPEFNEAARTTQTAQQEQAAVSPTTAAATTAADFTDTQCLDCHSNQDIMRDLASESEAPAAGGEGGLALVNPAPDREPWQRVWIDPEQFSGNVHATINCTACHGGKNVFDVEEAHEGLIPDPSDPAAGSQVTCATCHTDIAPYAEHSLHYTRRSLTTALVERGMPADHPALEEITTVYCAGCQATCGSCHISQPDPAGDGLLAGHAFVVSPPNDQTCEVCHGIVAAEYGGSEDLPRSIHAAAAYCTDCHSGAEMHGQYPTQDGDLPADEADLLNLVSPEESAQIVTDTYAALREPKCETCHAEVVGANSDIPQHFIHGTELIACEACHTVGYYSCSTCHIERTDDGQLSYTLGNATVNIVLGRNTDPSIERPYRYVPVRHVPVNGETFSAYGENVLPDLLSQPTWVYTTPHSIHRRTPQNQSCTSCHGNDEFFLTPDKVDPAELDANQGVMVEQAPPMPPGYDEYLDATEAAATEAPE